jgi:hypothetical protein
VVARIFDGTMPESRIDDLNPEQLRAASSKRNRIEKVQGRVGTPVEFLSPTKNVGPPRPQRHGHEIEEGCELIKAIRLRRPAFPKDPHDFLVARGAGSD